MHAVRMMAFMQKGKTDICPSRLNRWRNRFSKKTDGKHKSVSEWKNWYFFVDAGKTKVNNETCITFYRLLCCHNAAAFFQPMTLCSRKSDTASSVTSSQGNTRFTSKRSWFYQCWRMGTTLTRREPLGLFSLGHRARICVWRATWTVCKNIG